MADIMLESLVVLGTTKSGTKERFMVADMTALEDYVSSDDKYVEIVVTDRRGRDTAYRVGGGFLYKK